MTFICAVLLFFIPHPANAFLRRLFGQKIGKHTTIHLGSFIYCKRFSIGDHSYVGPLSILKTHTAKLGNYTHISALSITSAALIDGAILEIGDHSRIFPFCWLEPGEGIFIGKHVGIGGHTLIFTHGAWSDYLHGGPVNYGPVYIGDHTWLPWRVFILPNVTIGERAIIGANTTVNKNIPSNSLSVGSPINTVKTDINKGLTTDEFEKRVNFIFSEYNKYILRQKRLDNNVNSTSVFFRQFQTDIAPNEALLIIDMETYTYSSTNPKLFLDFISYLRRFGIRLEEK
ncbi:MAG: acyltransferase [Bdellovibrio sp.]